MKARGLFYRAAHSRLEMSIGIHIIRIGLGITAYGLLCQLSEALRKTLFQAQLEEFAHKAEECEYRDDVARRITELEAEVHGAKARSLVGEVVACADIAAADPENL